MPEYSILLKGPDREHVKVVSATGFIILRYVQQCRNFPVAVSFDHRQIKDGLGCYRQVPYREEIILYFHPGNSAVSSGTSSSSALFLFQHFFPVLNEIKTAVNDNRTDPGIEAPFCRMIEMDFFK
jgi:hypothetical protein